MKVSEQIRYAVERGLSRARDTLVKHQKYEAEAGQATLQGQAWADEVDSLEEAVQILKRLEHQPKVRKTSGHEFEGVQVIQFWTLSGQKRIVVESTVPGAKGLLFILRPDQVEQVDQ